MFPSLLGAKMFVFNPYPIVFIIITGLMLHTSGKFSDVYIRRMVGVYRYRGGFLMSFGFTIVPNRV